MGPVRICHSELTRLCHPVQSFCESSWVASQNGFHCNLDTMKLCAQAPFNGSHFDLPPSSIHRMTGLGGKMVWTMTYSQRLHLHLCSSPATINFMIGAWESFVSSNCAWRSTSSRVTLSSTTILRLCATCGFKRQAWTDQKRDFWRIDF